jgi:hypothetical protein
MIRASAWRLNDGFGPLFIRGGAVAAGDPLMNP